MFIRIETTSGVPITRQIADQIRAQCASEMLPPGGRLPSVRALARDLAVNQNTILRVYEHLTTEGLLERRHGDGTYVAQTLPPGQLKAQRRILRQQAGRLVDKAATLRVAPRDIHELIDEAFGRLDRQRQQSKGNQG